MYAPTPSKYRLSDILDGKKKLDGGVDGGVYICGPSSLSDVLVGIKRHCGDDDPFFCVLLGAIYRSICEAVELVLLKEKDSVRRTIDMDDASLIEEDMEYLKEWFVQDGVGINESDAVEGGRRLQQLVSSPFFLCHVNVKFSIVLCNDSFCTLFSGSSHGQSLQCFD